MNSAKERRKCDKFIGSDFELDMQSSRRNWNIVLDIPLEDSAVETQGQNEKVERVNNQNKTKLSS